MEFRTSVNPFPELQFRSEDLALRDPQVDVDLSDALKRLAAGGALEYRVQAAKEDVPQAFPEPHSGPFILRLGDQGRSSFMPANAGHREAFGQNREHRLELLKKAFGNFVDLGIDS